MVGNLTDALSGVLLDVAQTDQRYNKMFDIPGAKIKKEVKPGVWKEYTIDSNSLEVHLFTQVRVQRQIHRQNNNATVAKQQNNNATVALTIFK